MTSYFYLIVKSWFAIDKQHSVSKCHLGLSKFVVDFLLTTVLVDYLKPGVRVSLDCCRSLVGCLTTNMAVTLVDRVLSNRWTLVGLE